MADSFIPQPPASNFGKGQDATRASDGCAGVTDSGIVEKRGITSAASQSDIDSALEAGLEYRLDPTAQALLTDVMWRLRGEWLTGPALLWGAIHPIRQLTIPEVDKRIATTLATGFLQFSQFTCALEMLVLELGQRGVVSEKSILCVEQQLVNGRFVFSDKVEVPDADHRLGDVLSDAKG